MVEKNEKAQQETKQNTKNNFLLIWFCFLFISLKPAQQIKGSSGGKKREKLSPGVYGHPTEIRVADPEPDFCLQIIT